MANQGASNNQSRPARDTCASGGKILTGARCSLSQMPTKRFTAHQALTQILADDSEDINASDYGNDSDFESEVSADSCHDSDSSRSESDAAKPTATQPHGDTRASNRGQVHGRCHGTGRGAERGRDAVTNVGPGATHDNVDSDNSTSSDSDNELCLPPQILPRASRGRGQRTRPAQAAARPSGRGAKAGQRGRGCANGPDRPNQYQWTRDTSGFTDSQFSPNEQPGPKNLPPNMNEDSSPVEYLNLFWDDVLWQLLVTKTNRHAACVKAADPNNYCAKNFTDVSIVEMKAFFGCRVAMEMLIHKDRYEQYWRVKDNMLTVTPGFPKVIIRDRFLAIWSMLHCVNEDDEDLDKTDKVYKSRPVFTHLIEKFQTYYVANCELSLDEGMIPTKNSLSIKQYIKDKPIRWGIKTYLLCDSVNGYIINAEIYTGRRGDALEIDNSLVASPMCSIGNPEMLSTSNFYDGNVIYVVWKDKLA